MSEEQKSLYGVLASVGAYLASEGVHKDDVTAVLDDLKERFGDAPLGANLECRLRGAAMMVAGSMEKNVSPVARLIDGLATQLSDAHMPSVEEVAEQRKALLSEIAGLIPGQPITETHGETPDGILGFLKGLLDRGEDILILVGQNVERGIEWVEQFAKGGNTGKVTVAAGGLAVTYGATVVFGNAGRELEELEQSGKATWKDHLVQRGKQVAAAIVGVAAIAETASVIYLSTFGRGEDPTTGYEALRDLVGGRSASQSV